MEDQLAYFGALLVRGSSKELLGWTAQDLQHAMRWAEYWERVVHGMAPAGDATVALEHAVDRLHVKFPALRLSVGDLGRVGYPESNRAMLITPASRLHCCVQLSPRSWQLCLHLAGTLHPVAIPGA
eukprot:COSAG02_NODE_6368_length_3621_cov_1.933844_3_plen_126_part_00